MNFKLLLSISKTHLLTRKKQSAIAALGVTFGIGTYIIMMGFMNGLNGLLDGLILNRTPHIHLFNEIKPAAKQPLQKVIQYKNMEIMVHSIKPKRVQLKIHNALPIMKYLSERKEFSEKMAITDGAGGAGASGSQIGGVGAVASGAGAGKGKARAVASGAVASGAGASGAGASGAGASGAGFDWAVPGVGGPGFGLAEIGGAGASGAGASRAGGGAINQGNDLKRKKMEQIKEDVQHPSEVAIGSQTVQSEGVRMRGGVVVKAQKLEQQVKNEERPPR